MARVRSPNFPVISLPAAVDRIKKIYAKEQTIPATRETIAEHLGYSGINGASLKVISALLKYGLLEETKDKHFKVSQLALAILHPANDEESSDALRQAAEGPVLFQRLNAQFEGKRPSDTNLRSWLLRNGFATSAVDNVITAYSETIDLLGGFDSVQNPPETTEHDTSPHQTWERSVQTSAVKTTQSPARYAQTNEPFSVELMRDRFRVVGELACKSDALKLINILTMAANLLPDVAIAEHHGQDQDDIGG